MLLQETFGLVVFGCFLKGVGLFTASDAQSALEAAKYVTLPSLALQLLLSLNFGTQIVLGTVAAASSLLAAQLLVAWLSFGKRRRPERALLTGSSVGLAIPVLALPFAQVAAGAAGLQLAILWEVAAVVAGAGAMLLFASAGSAPPASYTHSDGGLYRGQWLGAAKHGLGQYRYPSGAKYAGEWASNQKTGLGIYTFPKGGMYEGEWQQGERQGVGVRLFKSRTYKAGRWEKGDLRQQMDLEQCRVTVEAAREAASQTHRVQLGGGTLSDAALHVLTQPVVAAAAAALAVTCFHVTLPAMVLSATEALAAAHIPLVLIAFGVQAVGSHLSTLPAQIGDIMNVLTLRYAVALGFSCIALLAVPSPYLPVAAAAAVVSLAPIPEQAVTQAGAMRLNTRIPSALVSMTRSISAGMMLTVALSARLMLTAPRLQKLSPRLLAILPSFLALVLLATRNSLERFIHGWVRYRQGFQQYRFVPSAAVQSSVHSKSAKMVQPAVQAGTQLANGGESVGAVQEVSPAEAAAETQAEPGEAEMTEAIAAEVLTESATQQPAEKPQEIQKSLPQDSSTDAATPDDPATSSSGRAGDELSGRHMPGRSRRDRRSRSRFRDVDPGSSSGNVRPSACYDGGLMPSAARKRKPVRSQRILLARRPLLFQPVSRVCALA